MFLPFALLGLALTGCLTASEIKPLRLKLPTANTAIVTGKAQDYYMYTTRNFEGVSSKPWTGGTYGYSRNLKRTSDGIMGTRFHEGIDIRPVHRDRAQRPLDIVHTISDGVVVYTNSVSGRSNYGKYVVVKHDWGYGPFYSLYAHLATITCKVGQKVKSQAPLGKMGYTGRGISLTRAHLHLELNIMWHPDFTHWHGCHYQSPNYHGAYNGINMSGLDIAGLFISNNSNPNLTIPTFIKNQPVYYKVTVPRKAALQICKNYPWLCKGNHKSASPSWEISFSSSTFPLAVTPSLKKVNSPTVTYVKKANHPHSYRSRGMLSGTGASATLSAQGKRHIQLILGAFPCQPPAQ